MNELMKEIRRQGEKAEEKAKTYLQYYEAAKTADLASLEEKEYASAEYWRNAAAKRLNDYFYWQGQAVMAGAIAAGMELRGMVEEKMDEEPSCP